MSLSSCLFHLKLFLYNLTRNKTGKFLLAVLACGIIIPPLSMPHETARIGKKIKKRPRKPFHVVITVDAEGGYVTRGEGRLWQWQNPGAYIGFTKGIANLKSVCGKYGARATYFLSTHCFSSSGAEYAEIVSLLQGLSRDGDEIGLHPHPDS